MLTKDNICIFNLLFDDIRRIEVTEDYPNIGVLGLELSGLFLATNESRELPVGMGIGDSIEAVATNIASSTSAVERVRLA